MFQLLATFVSEKNLGASERSVCDRAEWRIAGPSALGSNAMRDFCFSVDRGGTFTDVFAEIMDGKGASTYRVMKLLSVDPQHYQDAPREGIRRILEEVTGLPYPIDHPLDTSRIVSIRMGTTVATNALLERKGERTALLVTKGFPDLLYIANQSRPNIFDLQIQMPDNLYERVVEVDELVTLPLGDEAGQRNGTKHALNSNPSLLSGPPSQRRWPTQAVALLRPAVFTGTTGEQVCVRKAPDLAALKIELQKVLDAGIKSVAVVLKHSAIFSDHEHAVGRLAKEMGFTQISLSSVVMPMVKMVPRGFTAAADAYLTPHIMKYLNTFQAGFDVGLKDVQLLFMQSDGGLAPVERFSGHRAILSGPAGGYVGYALTTKWDGSVDEHGEGPQVIGFDMGGTSTDVSRFAGGTYEHVFETTVAGVTIQAAEAIEARLMAELREAENVAHDRDELCAQAAEAIEARLMAELQEADNVAHDRDELCAQAAEAIEARLMAELREAENVAHDRDELCAQVMLLRDKLSEQRAEKGQAEQYKQVVHELETGRSKLEEELMATAQLVTQLESRLRETLHKVDGSEMSVQVAERRAREAEAAVASEVELRMSAACSSRAFWPAPIRDEVARMEQRLSAMQFSLVVAEAQLSTERAMLEAEGNASLVVAEAQLSTERATIEAEGKAKYEALHALGQAQDSLGHTEELVKMKQLELNEAQELVEQARVTILKLEAANESDCSQARGRQRGTIPASCKCISACILSGDRVNGESASSKWQVQNSVGGGSLYGLGDKAQARSSTTSVASLSPRGSNSNIGESEQEDCKRHTNIQILPPPNDPGNMKCYACAAASKRPKAECVDVLYLNLYLHLRAPAAASKRPKVESVDVLYLKNVLLKFMEASVTGKVAERDVLLPAVATLLQASPAEFALLKKLLQNTAPPGTQMMSVFGFKV
eukprot:gene10437-8388_t